MSAVSITDMIMDQEVTWRQQFVSIISHPTYNDSVPQPLSHPQQSCIFENHNSSKVQFNSSFNFRAPCSENTFGWCVRGWSVENLSANDDIFGCTLNLSQNYSVNIVTVLRSWLIFAVFFHTRDFKFFIAFTLTVSAVLPHILWLLLQKFPRLSRFDRGILYSTLPWHSQTWTMQRPVIRNTNYESHAHNCKLVSWYLHLNFRLKSDLQCPPKSIIKFTQAYM